MSDKPKIKPITEGAPAPGIPAPRKTPAPSAPAKQPNDKK